MWYAFWAVSLAFVSTAIVIYAVYRERKTESESVLFEEKEQMTEGVDQTSKAEKSTVNLSDYRKK